MRRRLGRRSRDCCRRDDGCEDREIPRSTTSAQTASTAAAIPTAIAGFIHAGFSGFVAEQQHRAIGGKGKTEIQRRDEPQRQPFVEGHQAKGAQHKSRGHDEPCRRAERPDSTRERIRCTPNTRRRRPGRCRRVSTQTAPAGRTSIAADPTRRRRSAEEQTTRTPATTRCLARNGFQARSGQRPMPSELQRLRRATGTCPDAGAPISPARRSRLAAQAGRQATTSVQLPRRPSMPRWLFVVASGDEAVAAATVKAGSINPQNVSAEYGFSSTA